MNPVVDVIEPDAAAHAIYEQIYPVFEAAYGALVPVYDMLAKVE
jgi:sugar (pentulose or hexulose) kinase